MSRPDSRVLATLLASMTFVGVGCQTSTSTDPDTVEPPSTMTRSMPQRATELTLEDVAQKPAPGDATPSSLAFAPDDSEVTFLLSPDRTFVKQLFALSLSDGQRRALVEPPGGGVREEDLTLAEKLRRERQREHGLGIARYQWAKKGQPMLIPLGGDLWVKDDLNADLRLLLDTQDHAALDPVFSRDGQQVAFVQDSELYVVATAGGTPRQLTHGARGTGRTHGLAEFVAQEEMGRSHGFWWSHDGASLAYTEVDETHIPAYRIVHQGKDKVGATAQEDHGYPFAGAANARVRLAVIPSSGGESVWMDLGDDQDQYLARCGWTPDGRLSVQLQNRAQTMLRLLSFDPTTGRGEVVLTESSDVWINLHNMLRFLDEGAGDEEGAFVWASERTGFRHLYLYRRDGELLRPLTTGSWMVDELDAVDETARIVYFTATKDGPLDKHLYAVSLDGGEIRRITEEPGTHTVTIDHAHQRFVDAHNSTTKPPSVRVRSLADGRELAVLYDDVDPDIERLGLAPPRHASFQAADGTTLYAAVYQPPAELGPGPFPTVVSVYGGPHAQVVSNRWAMTSDLRAQYLRQQGVLVFKLDNRGSARRGLAFEGALKNDMGNIEVSDQVEGVRWLVEQGLTDPERVGIYGWSYGGYMAAMALGRAPETFKLAVAGAPVTDWDGYDTHYTERYMGTPESNPSGYESGSVMTHVGGMKGKLMLVHGLIDENVHFRHTARLIHAMITAGKDYELLLFPNERHGPRRLEDRVYMERRIFDFIARNL